MNNARKVRDVEKILLMEIVVKGRPYSISKEGDRIKSSQKYRGRFDPDMSDIAVIFYEVIYKDLLPKGNTLLNGRRFQNNDFSGDTMNSFATIANMTPGAGSSKSTRTEFTVWPSYLKKYYNQYHCLANFWLLPMFVGRTLWSTKRIYGININKATLCKDTMNCFLYLIQCNIDILKASNSEYFGCFSGFDDFIEIHYLTQDDLYANHRMNAEETIKMMTESIENRAKRIANSEHCNALWDVFNDLGLV